MEKMGATEELAKRVVEAKFEDIPSETMEYSKKLFLSCLGAIIGGCILPAGKILIKHTKEVGGIPEAGVVGAGFRTWAPNAALANGTFAHATELEDDSHPEGTFTCNVIPVALALGQKLGLSGKDVLEGFIVGYEVEARTALACLTAKRRGYMLAGTHGTIGSAATAAKMLGLDVGQTTMALSIAASQLTGLRRQAGTGCHFLEAGLAARNGLVAALLAKEGLTANPRIMEIKAGFCDAVAGEGEHDIEGVMKEFGKPFRVMTVGIKKYPCCYEEHRIIDGVLELVKGCDISYDDVESVEVEVNAFFPEAVQCAEPATGEEARFSVHHSIAAALLERRVFLEAYTDEKVVNWKFKEARKKVSVIVHPEWEWGSQRGINIVTVRLKDGRRFRREIEKARGVPPLYLATDEVMAKYRDCAQLVLSPKQVEQVASLASELDKMKDIGELMNIVTFPGKA